MKHQKIEAALNRALKNHTPDLLDTLLHAEVERETAVQVAAARPAKPARRIRSHQPALVFVSLLLAFLVGTISYQSPATLVALDINPSLEITANPFDRVIQVASLNDETQKLIGALPLKNKDLDEAIRCIIEALISNGYLESQENAILVSVSGKNQNGTSKAQTRIVADIKETLSSHQSRAIVYDQNLAPARTMEQTKAEAMDNQISTGKMLFIKKLSAQDPELVPEELADMPMKDIVHLAKDRKINLHKLLNFEDEKEASNAKGSESHPTDIKNDPASGDKGTQGSGKK